MLLIELLLALLLVAVVATLPMLYRVLRTQDQQARDLLRMRGQLEGSLAAGGSGQAELRGQIQAAQSALAELKSQLGSRLSMDLESHQALKRLEAIMAGSSTLGTAGENILEQALKQFPQELVARDVGINGKTVEFALRLPSGKLLPIDSKWTSVTDLSRLGDLEPDQHSRAVGDIEREVERRVREVGQYLDPTLTTPWAIAAIPDSAFQICRSAFTKAHQRHVVLMGYSMAVPYLLAIYQMHLQFGRGFDVEELQARMVDLSRLVADLDDLLQNRVARASTMLQNAYLEGKEVSGKMRSTLSVLQSTKFDRDDDELDLGSHGPEISAAQGQLPKDLN